MTSVTVEEQGSGNIASCGTLMIWDVFNKKSGITWHLHMAYLYLLTGEKGFIVI